MVGLSAHVVFVGALPPPLHGMSTVNAAMVDLIGQQAKVTAIAVSPSNADRRSPSYHFSKTARALIGWPRLLLARLKGARTLYAAADDGYGGIWTILFVATARLLGMRVFVHHHSYRYVAQRTGIMAAIVRSGGAATCHILLCENMAREFQDRYPTAASTMVVPNPVALPSPASSAPEIAFAGLTLGFLANVTFEKGVAEFVEIVERLVAKGLPVRGIVAGPLQDGAVQAFLKRKERELGPALRCAGPVYGAAKETFFTAIDIFVFPTKYRTEALPLVLMEALLRGCPVIAPARGCIGSYARNSAALIVPLEADIVPVASDYLVELEGDPARLAQLKVAAREDGEAANAANLERRATLIRRLTEAGPA